MYTNTSSAVWDGSQLSDWFSTTSGVRQGCGFSPAFFAMYINDLVDFIKGGVNINGLVINILMYADDIVLLAKSPEQLQDMINQLAEYCRMWDFRINLSKSKIMIFGAGRRAAKEKWFMGDLEVEIVSEYKYLGMIITPQLSQRNHLEQRLQSAKSSLSCTWSNLMSNKVINLDTKLKVFKACARSVLCYGAQVWGFKEYDLVEKLQRFFLKRLIGLPDNTPNYMLMLETGCSKIFNYTFKLHLDYVLKCLKMPNGRFPKIVARAIIDSKIFWYREWMYWLDKFNLTYNLENPALQNLQVSELVLKMEQYSVQNMIELANQGVHHDLYNQLKYTDIPKYFVGDIDLKSIRLIFKTRGGLLNLNTRLWAGNHGMICSLCNMNEVEDMLHFMGICPILKYFRLKYFGNVFLVKADVIDILNGRDWQALLGYIKAAYMYRQFLVDEFNG